MAKISAEAALSDGDVGDDDEEDEGATAEDDNTISAAGAAEEEEDAEEDAEGLCSDTEAAEAAVAVVSSAAAAAAEAGSFLALASAFLALSDFTCMHAGGSSGWLQTQREYGNPRDEKDDGKQFECMYACGGSNDRTM